MIAFKDGLTIGGDSPIRVNCNIGCNKIEDIQSVIYPLPFEDSKQFKDYEKYGGLNLQTQFIAAGEL